MTDIVFESLRLILLGVILWMMHKWASTHGGLKLPGWRLMVSGVALLVFSMAIDLTDNFPALNRFVIIGDTPVQAFLEKMFGAALGYGLLAVGLSRWIPGVAEKEKRREEELASASEQLKTLGKLLPICAWCGKVRDDDGYWSELQDFISAHSDTVFSHGLCVDCERKVLAELNKPPQVDTGTG